MDFLPQDMPPEGTRYRDEGARRPGPPSTRAQPSEAIQPTSPRQLRVRVADGAPVTVVHGRLLAWVRLSTTQVIQVIS
jgi:hypothetical protein